MIVYASQTNSARQLALWTSRVTGLPAVECGEVGLQELRTGVFLFLVATAGDGEVPVSMAVLWRSLLDSSLSPDFYKMMKFGVFGLGDSSYKIFNAAGRRLSKRLRQLGAEEMLGMGLGDDRADNRYMNTYKKWLQQFNSKLKSQKPAKQIITLKHKWHPTQLASHVISSRDGLRTWQVRIPTPCEYKGESIACLQPANSQQTTLGLSYKQYQFKSLRLSHLYLSIILERQLDEAVKSKLQEIMDTSLFFQYSGRYRRTIADLCDDFEGVKPGWLRNQLVEIEPRYFSVSNNPRKDGFIRLLVREVKEVITPFRNYQGVLSRQLCEGRSPVNVKFLERPPWLGQARKILSICGGTGVAPLLKIVAEDRPLSKLMVFRVARYAEQLYYREELAHATVFQAVTRQPPKNSLIGLLEEKADKIMQFVNMSTHIFIVMPGLPAGTSVLDTLSAILKDRFQALKQAKQIQLECW